MDNNTLIPASSDAYIHCFEVYMALEAHDPKPRVWHVVSYLAERYPRTRWEVEENAAPLALSDGTELVHYTVFTILGERTRHDLLEDSRILAWAEVVNDEATGAVSYPIVWSKAGFA